ncbi:MAG: glycosyl hydrolase [Anaerolineaceae bacterium]|nr:glycosyl hydrolase [Anaerolineaceae bacterium]
MKHEALISQISLPDKIAFCSGASFFSTKAYPQYNIPDILMVDGPHGLRKQLSASDHLGINRSVPATSFPTASLTACSWDRTLLREMGAAIAEEALQEGVSIVLGPGANIKRNPLCGRNFEYFSEDPYLSGEMAASWIDGLQSKGVGASLKHFAANNQENERMCSDSIVDERALRELYLPAFEKAVKQGRPATVMCAYNMLNGVYCSDNRYLLREILREEWGFTGVIVTDWGAMNDRIAAFAAGLDLEMPTSNGCFDTAVFQAIKQGKLPEERVDECVDRLLSLILTVPKPQSTPYSVADHHQLAKRIAAEAAVLLKNDNNLLPLARGKTLALIGALAEFPRYQGAGSSHINPTQLANTLDGFAGLGRTYDYYPGYPLRGPGDQILLAEAVAGARQADVAVVVAGLPESFESEGFDRATMAMPDSHNELITRVAEANPNTIVVLVGGAPVEMPWLPQVKAVLNMYLAGQAGGLATAELLTGVVNPSGKLAETYPVRYEDVPSAGIYETGGKQAQYRESFYVGYRYFDTARQAVQFPFGHGLSYTNFAYSDLLLSATDLTAPHELTLTVTIQNNGDVAGAEVVQVYVRAVDSPVFRPEKELKQFAKLHLAAGEERQVALKLDARAFAIYDTAVSEWIVPTGTYQILVGSSSRDIRLQAEVMVRGTAVSPTPAAISNWYTAPAGQPTQADFESLLGRKIVPIAKPRKGNYTVASTFSDMQDSFIVRQVINGIERTIAKDFGGADYENPSFKMIMSSTLNTPLKNLHQLSPGQMSKQTINGIVHLANGKLLRGITAFLQRRK